MMETAVTVIVTDKGFAADEWAEAQFLPLESLLAGETRSDAPIAVDFPNDRDPAELQPWFGQIELVRVAFPAMGDGRGFSIAARLRQMGYRGRLRAAGPLVADQYAAARRTGYDEVEIPEALAERQPESAWLRPAKPDYRAKLGRS
jgi:uncharacterized protein (DUF934 family)